MTDWYRSFADSITAGRDKETTRELDRTLLMVGLILLADQLFKSGYPQPVQDGIEARIKHLLKTMGVDTNVDRKG